MDDLTACAVRVVAVAAGASLAAVLLFPAYLSVRAAGARMFEPERFDYALLAAAVFGIALGVQVVPWRTGRYVALVAMLASAALLFAVLASFSIGLAFLPAGVVLLVVLFFALRRRDAATGRAAALGGASIGYAAVLLFIAQGVPPTAECHERGAGSSGPRWNRPQAVTSSGGGAIGGGEGVFTGRMEFASSVVTFRCESGRLVDFQRIQR